MADFKIASDLNNLVAEEAIQLPSQVGTDEGVLLRKPNVIKLLHEGQVIDLLSPLVSEWTGAPSAKVGGSNELELVMSLLEKVPELEPRLNKVVLATIKAPEPTEEKVLAMSVRDRVRVLVWALGEEFGDLQGMFRRLAQSQQRVQPLGEIPTVGDATK